MIINGIRVRGQRHSPTTLKPAGRTHHSHRLIHDPLANTEVIIDPSLEFFALGDLFGLETGADDDPAHTRPDPRVWREGSEKLAGLS